jgi:hypothetical protein
LNVFITAWTALSREELERSKLEIGLMELAIFDLLGIKSMEPVLRQNAIQWYEHSGA